jgi:hypothetical protein
MGTCSNLPALADDPPLCTATMACSSAGVCKKANGQPCNGNNDCASGVCTGNPKLCQ